GGQHATAEPKRVRRQIPPVTKSPWTSQSDHGHGASSRPSVLSHGEVRLAVHRSWNGRLREQVSGTTVEMARQKSGSIAALPITCAAFQDLKFLESRASAHSAGLWGGFSSHHRKIPHYNRGDAFKFQPGGIIMAFTADEI